MHGRQVISIFIFFSKYPFGGISYTLPLLGFQFRFFCLFTQTQPHKNQSDPNKIFVFFIFQYTLIGSPPTLQEVMQILRGEIVKSKLPSFYAVPPLRICKEGSLKRKSYDQEPSHVKRTYHKQQNVPYNQPSSY